MSTSLFLKEHFIELDNIKSHFSRRIPKPSVYGNSTNGNIIISTSSSEFFSVAGIYEFNINTNQMSLIHKYDSNISLDTHGQCIVNDQLYLYGNEQCKGYSFNFKTNKIKDNYKFPQCKFDNKVYCPTSIYIPSPINQIHIVDANEHFICEIDGKNNISLSNSEDFHTSFAKLIFVPFKQQLMSLGGWKSEDIFYYNMDENCLLQEWKKYSLVMPYSVHHMEYDILLSFKTLLFIFYFVKQEIWCLDLKNNILCQSKCNIPDYFGSTRSIILPIKDKNNNIHIINSITGAHCMILLHKLIPDKIQKCASKQYNSLIIGYIKELENDLIIPTIPFVVKQLIWHYFPSFV